LLRSQLRALVRAGFAVDVICGPGALVDALAADGFRVHVVRNSRRLDPAADLRTLRAYVSLFRRERYDLVHTHNPKVNLLASLAARVAGVPRVVSTVHGLYSHEGQGALARRVWRGFEAASARLADLVLCQSVEDVRTARWDRVVPDERLRPLGNGIDLTRFHPGRLGREDRDALRRRLGVAPGERVVGFVGRLVREKGVVELVEAAAQQRGLRLWLIGPDERGAKADALRPEDLAGAPHVTWLGLQRDMPPLYAALDVAALPSWREGFPRSLLEAAAMGRPIVATRIRGCREAVEDGRTGLLVPVRRPAALREALGVLLADPARRRRMGRAARLRAEEAFDEEAVFERIVRAYREIPLPASALPLRAPAPERAAA
ncbi:MAG: glycosyltransferase family 4 protein, partial [Myxococcota bacterium]|nr:glycosyltransferase family 4 protein [Myxococcota bacterium]